MPNKFIFADEAGDFTFNRQPNVSRYFIICTVTMNNLAAGDALHALRHDLVWERAELGECFHATSDSQAVRDRVFAALLKHDFQIQATICEKAKAQPQVRVTRARFYKYPWFYQFKHGLAPHLSRDDKLLVTAASLGTRRERDTFTNAIGDVVAQTAKCEWVVDFRPSTCDPCLQVADYCAWAIQRKWERDDTRSYDLVRDRITYEYELWRHGKTLYY